jgi:HK97 family phage prohead protease
MIERGVPYRLARFAPVSTLRDDQIEAIIITGQLARDGDVWEPGGCQVTNFLKNPIATWQHLPEEPIGTWDVRVSNNVVGTLTFAPTGVSATADRVRGLVKSGVVKGISAGILPIDVEPLNPNRPRDGSRITKYELIEVAVVSIPADTGAGVIARSHRLSGAASAALMRLRAELARLPDGPADPMPTWCGDSVRHAQAVRAWHERRTLAAFGR